MTRTDRSTYSKDRPLPWEVWDALEGSPPTLRVFFIQSATATGVRPLIRHDLEARKGVIIVRLWEGPVGDGSEPEMDFLVAIHGCVDLAVEEQVGQTQVIDGTTGRPRPRLARTPEAGTSDWLNWRAADRRCIQLEP